MNLLSWIFLTQTVTKQQAVEQISSQVSSQLALPLWFQGVMQTGAIGLLAAVLFGLYKLIPWAMDHHNESLTKTVEKFHEIYERLSGENERRFNYLVQEFRIVTKENNEAFERRNAELYNALKCLEAALTSHIQSFEAYSKGNLQKLVNDLVSQRLGKDRSHEQ